VSEPATRRRPAARALRTVALVVVASVVACGLVEIGLRVAYRSPPGLHFSVRAPTYRPDPELGYALRPGARLVWGTREFVERDAINADGFRDEPTPARDGETLVLAVGDSFTFGHGVQMRESYPKVLQRMLRARGRSVRVINAGVPGYGMDQTFKLVSHHGAALRPDLVLVGVQCSDVFDAFDVPLYDVRDGRLVELDATKTYPFLQGRLAELAPRIVARSFAFGVILAGGPGWRPVRSAAAGDGVDRRLGAREDPIGDSRDPAPGLRSPGAPDALSRAPGSADHGSLWLARVAPCGRGRARRRYAAGDRSARPRCASPVLGR
jgi:hypothetical protein